MAGSNGQEHREMLELNQKQTSYYEAGADRSAGLPTRLWTIIRDVMEQVRVAINVDADLYTKHWDWLGDLSDKRVLDLGCYEGNPLSLQIAERSASYLGIDLSARAIGILDEKLSHIEHAHAEVADFLSPDFIHEFDVIYARSVAHHFKYFDAFLGILNQRLRPGGIVVTFDPLETSLPIKIARALYRPFQTDAAWEWPFRRRNFYQIQDHFEIAEVFGIMGRAKWAVPLALFGKKLAIRVGRRFHADDLVQSRQLGRGLWRCMAVSMCWRKRD